MLNSLNAACRASWKAHTLPRYRSCGRAKPFHDELQAFPVVDVVSFGNRRSYAPIAFYPCYVVVDRDADGMALAARVSARHEGFRVSFMAMSHDIYADTDTEDVEF